MNKNKFLPENPLTIKQQFRFESLYYYYTTFQSIFLNSSSVTRKKQIQLPLMSKIVSNKMGFINAIKLFNELPNDLKTLDVTKNKTIFKLKKWIRSSVLN